MNGQSRDTERAIMNGQSRDTGNIGHTQDTRRRQTKHEKDTTHYRKLKR